ncbi:HAD hydrolase-like protein [Candidatus Haliotispira prima]|uniref:HAD hydrolase-like protein n=1 Tax=Candidatus Haliotispira prima TaxID=3034016 RepID=A0ABY8MH44_9SPIO|nr:HAD hydrolase-like protein [Candidatus Haliotispira prima]
MNRIWNSKDLEQMLEPNDWMRLQEQVRSRVADLQPIATGTKSKLSPIDNVRGVLFDVYGTLIISAVGEIISGQISDRANDNAKAQQDGDRHSKVPGGTAPDKMAPDEKVLDTQVLQSLPELLRASLSKDFEPSRAIKESILQQHKQNKNPSLQYPEVDIVSLWHQVFLQQLNEDMHNSLSPFILARFALEYELLHNRVQLMPGAQELLHWLATRNFYVGIISNAQFYTPIILSALLNLHELADLNVQPDLCLWSYRQGCSKPQPELFDAARSALAHHDLEPKEMIYLGNDMRNDVWGAAQAGFYTGLFAGDQRSLRLRGDMPEVAATEPDIVITELGQLKSIL